MSVDIFDMNGSSIGNNAVISNVVTVTAPAIAGTSYNSQNTQKLLLAPDHHQDLKKSGLTAATIATAKIVAVPPNDIAKVLGYNIPDVISAYRIPFDNGFERVKVFYHPDAKAANGKKLRKYHQKKNTGSRLYVPATLDDKLLVREDVTLYIIEGEKKCLKAIQDGLACVGITGLWNWKRKGTDELIFDFTKIKLSNRKVVIVPDSDWRAPDKNLIQAVERLARALQLKGAQVSVLSLPEDGGEKLGYDDYTVKFGFDKFKALVPEVFPVEPFCRLERSGVLFYETERVPVKDENGKRTGDWTVQYKPPVKVTDAIEILAYVRNDKNREWGTLLTFRDKEGFQHRFVMEAEHLARDGESIRKELLNRGLFVHSSPKCRNALNLYLQLTGPEYHEFVRCTRRTGWHGDAFVLPDTVIGNPEEPIIYLGNQEAVTSIKGSLDEWQNQISKKCIGNSRLTFGVSLALAPAILHICNRENGGFHFRGGSTSGKSTVLYVIVSVWGGPEYKKSWRTTINGLEGIAASRNDLVLVLDEIGQSEPRDIGSAAYLLANGEGKVRANKDGDARDTKGWRLLFASSGEISLADHARSEGKKIKAGQDIRLLDIPADIAAYGAFEELKGHQDGDDFAKALKESASEHYGHAGIAFLNQILNRKDEVIVTVRDLEQRFKSALPPGSDSQVVRVASRFALVAAAGELATSFGITDWPKNAAIEASLTCMRDWINARGGVMPHETREALAQVRRFFENHGVARFSDWEYSEGLVHNRAGFRKRNPDDAYEYYVLPETFRQEICAGLNVPFVTSLLIERGILKPGDNSSTVNVRLPGLGQKRCYHITSKVLEVG